MTARARPATPRSWSATLQAWIGAIRTGPRAELMTAVAFVLVLPLAAVHWLGLVAAGAIVGLTAATTRRALVLGVFLGLFVVLGFVGWLWLAGALGKAVATGQLFGLSLAVGFTFPILGASVRGLG
ncbi:MAG: hypothetical protein ABEI57_00825 [Halapricum sp.]